MFKAVDCGTNYGIDEDHSGALVEVARHVAVTAGQLAVWAANDSSNNDKSSSAGRSKLARKASGLLRAARQALSSLCWDSGAKRSSGSGKLASWFTG